MASFRVISRAGRIERSSSFRVTSGRRSKIYWNTTCSVLPERSPNVPSSVHSCSDGLVVGKLLGYREGLMEGLPLTTATGNMLGTADGTVDGCPVGDSL